MLMQWWNMFAYITAVWGLVFLHLPVALHLPQYSSLCALFVVHFQTQLNPADIPMLEGVTPSFTPTNTGTVGTPWETPFCHVYWWILKQRSSLQVRPKWFLFDFSLCFPSTSVMPHHKPKHQMGVTAQRTAWHLHKKCVLLMTPETTD